MATDGAATCHLLNLPRELRDEIYIRVFRNVKVRIADYPPEKFDEMKHSDSQALALLATSRQIHQEAKSISLAEIAIKYRFSERIVNILNKRTIEERTLITHIQSIVCLHICGDRIDEEYDYIVRACPGVARSALRTLDMRSSIYI